MIKALICLAKGHKDENDGPEIVVAPHESVAHMGPAIFQEKVCQRCGRRVQAWVRHPYEELL
jgi:hypothetical protein